MDGPDEAISDRIGQAARAAADPERSLLPFSRDADRRRDLVELHMLWDLTDPPDLPIEDVVRRQTQYNAAVTRLISDLAEQNEALTRTINALEAHLERIGRPWSADGQSPV